MGIPKVGHLVILTSTRAAGARFGDAGQKPHG